VSLIQICASKFSKKDQHLGRLRNIIDQQNNRPQFRQEDHIIAEIDVSNQFDFMEGGLSQIIITY
jgi:hypothetical protein